MPKFIEDFFKDKKGNWTIWQPLNLPIITWGIAQLLTMVLPYGRANFTAELIAYGSLFTWAWLEITSGTSYFRRTLGAIILIHLITSRI